MIKEDRIKIMENLFEECRTLTSTKGKDYSTKEDSLYNFKRQAENLGLSKYQIWSVYFNKHIDAINSGIRYSPENPEKGVASEPLKGRILDAITYLTILQALLVEDATTFPHISSPSSPSSRVSRWSPPLQLSPLSPLYSEQAIWQRSPLSGALSPTPQMAPPEQSMQPKSQECSFVPPPWKDSPQQKESDLFPSEVLGKRL